MPATIDITPSPRILRTLGEIPFQPWQCIAELIDNSIDAFAEAHRAGTVIPEKRVTVGWSNESVGSSSRTIEIMDTGQGMNLCQLQNAARAGYSSNDPINNLGLFGMGFNIATARLGETTRLLSAEPESSEWVGIEIDFDTLIHSKNYAASIISMPKMNQLEHGTKVIVSNLKGETYTHLRDKESDIRRQLENIYSPILSEIDVEIYLQGKKLSRRSHCVWGRSRYVTRDSKQVPAIVDIDRDLGKALFDVDKNSYLSRDAQQEIINQYGTNYPSNIIERRKRLRGWVGIQRYANPNDYGIDFIRNGRKILISNKQLFYYDNPMTGSSKLEYPVELGTTVGGRIVGEVHVDYLLPTYQKNDFDRTDPSWNETVEALRGIGPILPQDRKAMGYTDSNDSPIGLLVNGYRRCEPGTKFLFIEKGIAKDFAERFRRGEPDYLSDDKCWQAAQEADRLNATRGAGNAPDVDGGNIPSGNPDEYGPSSVSRPPNTTVPTTTPSPAAVRLTTTLDSLITKSRAIASWCGDYTYSASPPLVVRAWELRDDTILIDGEQAPCAFFRDGVECDFIYNPRHPLLVQFPIEPRILLSLYLAEMFKARDRISDIAIIFSQLAQNKLQDLRVDKAALQEKAAAMFDHLREKMVDRLSGKKQLVLDCIHESIGEVEETVMCLLSNGTLVIQFQNKSEEGFAAIQYVPFKTLLRLVDRFPEDLFDGKLFLAPYLTLSLSDTQATERARNESKERILSFLKDALWISQSGGTPFSLGKDELYRYSHSINFLALEMAD